MSDKQPLRRLAFVLKSVGGRVITILAFAGCGATVALAQTTRPQEVAFPTLPAVTLHLQDVSRKQLLDAFADQTQVKFGEFEKGFWTTATWPEATVSMELDNEPFWSALERIQEVADVGFVPLQDFSVFLATKSRGSWGWTGRPEAIAGPLLLSIRRVTRQSTAHLGDADRPTVELGFDMFAQPLPGQNYVADANGFAITSASDDAGHDLLANAVGVETGATVLPHLLLLSGRLTLTGANHPKSIQLGGSLRCDNVPSIAIIERADAEREAIHCEIAGHPMQISVARRADLVDVTVIGERPANISKVDFGRFGKRLLNVWAKSLKLTDHEATPCRRSAEGLEYNGDQLVMRLSYAPASGPLTLRWEVPSSEVPFTFAWTVSDIPVP